MADLKEYVELQTLRWNMDNRKGVLVTQTSHVAVGIR